MINGLPAEIGRPVTELFLPHPNFSIFESIIMKHLRLCTLAAALLAVGSAQALTPSEVLSKRGSGLVEVDVSGASAIRLSVGAAFIEYCKPATVDIFWNDANGSNYRAYSCTLAKQLGNYGADTDIVLYKRDQGGSTNGIRPVSDSVGLPSMFINGLAGTDTGGTCTASATPSATRTDVNQARWICGTTQTRVPAIGLSDEEPALLNAGVNLSGTAGTLTNLSINPLALNIFGVVVNTKLRDALQTAQGLTAGSELPENQPSLPKSFVTSAFAGKINIGAGLGWQQVGLTGTNGTKKVNVARRTVGSGTQAASNAYFLGGNCVAGANSPAGSQTSTATQVGTNQDITSYSSSGTLIGSFATANTNNAFQLAVLGRENSPTPTGTTTDNGYRFVKLNGVAPTRDNARTGLYDFVYENSIQWRLTDDLGDIGALGRALLAGVPTAASLAAADVDTQEGLLAPYRTWTAGDATATANNYNARVTRSTGASCTSLVFVQ